MSKTVITVDQHPSVVLPPEVLDSLGVEAGEQVEIEIVGRAMVPSNQSSTNVGQLTKK